MPYPRYVSEPLRPKLWEPDDEICRWCEYFTHATVAHWWWDYRCGLDQAKVDMWGTCDAWRMAMPQHVIFQALSAHEKATALATKGESYHIVR